VRFWLALTPPQYAAFQITPSPKFPHSSVYTRDDHPVDWAMTQNNLGIALQDQGIRTDGAKGADLLADAVTAYRAALEVYTSYG